MLSHVPLQQIRLFACVVALVAGNRYLAGVFKHVVLQTTGVTERVVALFTSKRLFSGVCDLDLDHD